MGSITQTFGLGYFYRSSKAALNMAMRSMSRDPAAGLKKNGVIVGMLDPGPTDTDMMADLRQRVKLRATKVAVSVMIRNISNLTMETTGSYLSYTG
jgi:NAD(P)-dependent dehydrogenase (short-subunit alcohol dehydrogenase family)